MSLPSGFLDELRARVPLSSVVGRRLRLTRAGREFKSPCPFHNEKTPSFYVNDQKGFFHCFGCGAHGDIIGFLMRIANLSFPEAVEQLAAEAGLSVPQSTPEDRQRFERQKSLYDLLEQATQWFEAQLRAPAGRAALDYLRGRSLDDEALARFRLGYAPSDGAALSAALVKQGFKIPDMVEVGLLKRPDDGRDPYSFFRHRVLFPVADRRGRVVAFGGRLIEGDGPKYVNTPDTPLFHKGQLLYGLSRARQAAADGQPVIVAEGYMDVIALVRAGFGGAVAPLGTALTEAQILELWKLIPAGARVPVLCFDGDNAGRRAAFRAVERTLPLLQPDHSVRLAFMPQGEDPDSLIRNGGTKAMQAVLDAARPLVDVLWDMEVNSRPSDTPEARAGIRQAIEVRIQAIADKGVQGYYRDEMRRRLDEAFGWRPPQRGEWRGRNNVPQKPAVRRTRPMNAEEQRQRVILATLANHPQLFEEFGEALALAVFTSGVLDELRAAMVLTLEADSALDADGLALHLKATGLQGALDELLSSSAVVHAGFASRKAELDEAREGWLHTWSLMQQRQMGADLRAVEQAMAQNLTPETFSRLVAMQEEVRNSVDDSDTE